MLIPITASAIIALKNIVTEHFVANPDFNQSGCLVWVERIEGTNQLQFWASATFAHVPWHDRGSQEEIKFEFILFLQKQAKKLGFKMVSPVLPVSVIDTEEEQNSKENARKRVESIIRPDEDKKNK